MLLPVDCSFEVYVYVSFDFSRGELIQICAWLQKIQSSCKVEMITGQFPFNRSRKLWMRRVLIVQFPSELVLMCNYWRWRGDRWWWFWALLAGFWASVITWWYDCVGKWWCVLENGGLCIVRRWVPSWSFLTGTHMSVSAIKIPWLNH